MYYRNYLERLVTMEDLLLTTVLSAEDGSENNNGPEFEFSAESINTIRQEVRCNEYLRTLSTDGLKNLIETAWYHDADTIEPSVLWDSLAIAKMREPICHGLDVALKPEELRRLAELT